MNDTIKEAVLALAETNPELARELVKETTAGASNRELDTVMQVVYRLKGTNVSTIRWALDMMDRRTRTEVVRKLLWLDDHMRDATKQMRDAANRKALDY